MSRAGALAYHAVATIAMLAHVVLVGLASLVTLSLTSPAGTELALLILQGAVVVSWLGLGVLGLLAWSTHSWLVLAVPIASFAVLWVIDALGESSIHWFLNAGY